MIWLDQGPQDQDHDPWEGTIYGRRDSSCHRPSHSYYSQDKYSPYQLELKEHGSIDGERVLGIALQSSHRKADDVQGISSSPLDSAGPGLTKTGLFSL